MFNFETRVQEKSEKIRILVFSVSPNLKFAVGKNLYTCRLSNKVNCSTKKNQGKMKF